MTVKAILSSKGNNVVTIKGNDTLLSAVQIMTKNGIGALVVTGAQRRVLGIFTERDFARRVASFGEAALDQTVSEVMTRNVVTCNADTSIGTLNALMSERRFRHVPVVDKESQLCGIVSSGDITKYMLDQAEREASNLKNYIQG